MTDTAHSGAEDGTHACYVSSLVAELQPHPASFQCDVHAFNPSTQEAEASGSL
ncbi:mCG1044129, isoform CRA_c [Mus musculus]|nr:mCG1044129, isoform CRA_c [Mus musculus]